MMASTEPFESRLFRSYWDDGLLDLLAGVGVTGVAVFWAMDVVALGAVVPAVLATLWVPLRRAVVEPRIGLAEFSRSRIDRMHGLGLAAMGLGAAVLLLFGVYVTGSSPAGIFPSGLAPAIPSLLLGLMAALTGWGLGLSRFFVYAGVLGTAGLAVAVADARPEVAMFAGAVVLLANGTWLLHRLLRLPIEREEDA